MDPVEFRRAGHAVIDWIADYLARPERWPVLPPLAPGDVRAELPDAAPEDAEPFDLIFDDFQRLIVKNTTHWNHPGFLAYFSSTGSAPGVLAETLIAALNVNAMLWRTGPAATELEEVTLTWLARLLGLPPELDGTINDTASTSTLHALAAARELHPELRIREQGLAGRADLPQLRVYCSAEAHSSVDKAAVTLGLGLEGVRRVAADANDALDVGALEHAVAEDRRAGVLPIAVVGTVGTTSTTGIDPIRPLVEICQREGLWLHVDAAYGGAAALLPEMRHAFDGWERADSIVVNPHKWMFVPIDCSVLYTRRPDLLKRAFSLVPEYLTTTTGEARNLMDYGVALGRRMRALKLWFVLRHFGAAGMRERLRHHLQLARRFADNVRSDNDFELLADVRFSVVVFRCRPAGLDTAAVEQLNGAILERVNASGEVFLSHTRARGSYALRLAIGNIRTSAATIDRAWQLVREAAAEAAGRQR